MIKFKIIMLTGILLAALILPGFDVLAQGGEGEDEPLFESAEDFRAALQEAVESGDVDPFWDRIVEGGQMPLIFDDVAVFLYRDAEATTVAWRMGGAPQSGFPDWNGVLMGEELWVTAVHLPLDARIDYHIVVDHLQEIPDPLNPIVQSSWAGDFSVIQMPDYAPPQEIIPRDDVERGDLTDELAFESEALDVSLPYWVYTPPGYEDMDDLPVIYANDGGGYIHSGFMPTVLDNMLADGLIEPVIVVFIDPVDTSTDENMRSYWFGMSRYNDFLANEMVPYIDAEYDTDPSPDARLLLGLSLGGFNAIYVSMDHPDVFHLFAAQSPVVYSDPADVFPFGRINGLPLRYFINQGLYDLDVENIRLLRDILDEDGFDLLYIETADGHSWGNWRGLLDDLLLYFFAVEEPAE